MRRNSTQWIMFSISLIIVMCSAGQGHESAATASAMDEVVPKLSYAFNDSPQHKAIVKMLRETGEDQMLQTANSVAMSEGKDFANVVINYSIRDEPAEAEIYLFKEDEAWVAYRELPTRKDHAAIFTTLARHYCQPRYKHLQGVSLIDDTWQSKNPEKRIINIVCSELINNQWEDHRVTFVYEYNGAQGWHITGQSETKQTSVAATEEKGASASPVESSTPKGKPTVIWGNAKDAIDEILKFIGNDPKPVFIVFGTAGQNFIQFHYLAENGGKDIQSVDWLNGKIKGPQVSRLARPCPPIPLEEINFGHVAGIFDEMRGKAMQGDMINVNLSRRYANGCKEVMWQGIASSGKHSLIVTYSIDGRQTDSEEFRF